MGQELQIPAIFQQKGVAKAFQGQVNAFDDNLADGIGQSYPVISYRGKAWALRHRGERKIVTRPDDGTQSGHLDVVILGQARAKSKSYYKKYDPNNEGERPICASIDGVVPDIDVTAKQSDTCALCQRNVWKTDPDTGRKGRECADYKRLAVLVAPNQSKAALGSALVEPMFLRVPADSLNSLAIMGDTMSSQGFHYSTYWTRITFDPVKAHPCMVFRPVQPVKDEEVGVILELRNNPAVGRITGGDIALQGPRLINEEPEMPSLTTTVTQQLQQEPVDDAPSIAPAAKAEAPSGGRGRPAGSKNKPKPAVQPAAQPALQETVPDRQESNGQNAGASADANADADVDTGTAEPSDDELDAEIAKLISR
jgi:hypothetical protein